MNKPKQQEDTGGEQLYLLDGLTQSDRCCSVCGANTVIARTMCQRCYGRDYRQRNRETCNKKRRDYYNRNRDAIIARTRLWYARNPNTVRRYKHTYRLRNVEKLRKIANDYYYRNLENCRKNALDYSRKNRKAIRIREQIRRRLQGVMPRRFQAGELHPGFAGGKYMECRVCGGDAGWHSPSVLLKNKHGFLCRKHKGRKPWKQNGSTTSSNSSSTPTPTRDSTRVA